jgi:hypothetical protein
VSATAVQQPRPLEPTGLSGLKPIGSAVASYRVRLERELSAMYPGEDGWRVAVRPAAGAREEAEAWCREAARTHEAAERIRGRDEEKAALRRRLAALEAQG